MDRRTFVTMLVAAPSIALLPAALTACGGDSDTGVRVVDADAAAEFLLESPPADLVVLDIRTPSEYSAGHLPDATLLDFYRADFADQLATLDRDVPYLMYCRSGNRSSEARKIMQDLGFTDVRDINGGFVSWYDAGHPYVVG